MGLQRLQRNCIVLVLLLGTMPSPTNGGETSEGTGQITEPKEVLNGGVTRFNGAVCNEPGSGNGHAGHGPPLAGLGNLESAVADLTAAIQRDPAKAEAYRERASLYTAMGDYDRAIADLDEAIRLNPTDSDARCNRGCVYLNKRSFGQAIVDLTEAIRLDPSGPMAYLARGNAFSEEGAYDRAIADFTKAIEIDPTDATGYMLRAGTNAERGNLEQAVADISEAIRLNSQHAGAYLVRADLRYRQQAYESAIADLDEAIRLTPDSRSLHELRGAAWIELEQYDRGLTDLEIAIGPDAEDCDANSGTGPQDRVDAAAIDHGKQQVSQMLKDRPAMGQHGDEAQALYAWAARKFAGEDLGQRVFWDPSQPPAWTCGWSSLSPAGAGSIRLAESCRDGADKIREFSFEELWHVAVFELYNVCNWGSISQLASEIPTERFSKEGFVRAAIECESRAGEKARVFYVRVFLPWAKEHRVHSHPRLWLGVGLTHPNEKGSPAIVRETNPAALRYYERIFDLAILDFLVRKSEYQEALELATALQKQGDLDDEELLRVHLASGFCGMKLGRPGAAVEAMDKAIRIDPRNAGSYVCRAYANLQLNDGQRAVADCDAAIRLKPSWGKAYRIRSCAYKIIGDQERAKADEEMAESLSESREGQSGADKSIGAGETPGSGVQRLPATSGKSIPNLHVPPRPERR